MLKTCSTCHISLPADTDHFYRAKGLRSGLRAQCKACNGKAQAAYREQNPSYPRVKAWRAKNWERVLAHNRAWRSENAEQFSLIKRRQRLRQQGWTLEDVAAALERQGGLCAVNGCGNPATDADHCHANSHPRALLCGGCNKSLGLLKEDTARIRGLAAYVEEHCDPLHA